jgi:hypothetical protein
VARHDHRPPDLHTVPNGGRQLAERFGLFVFWTLLIFALAGVMVAAFWPR